jgi:catecholate siderophore receptor
MGLLGAALLAVPSAHAQAQDSAPVMLGPVTVQGVGDRNALTHSQPLSAMPTTSLQDTPQAVSVVDQETMKQQATTTLDSALRNVPGITISLGEGGTLAGGQFKIRGFDAKDDVYLDGLRDFAAYTRDSFDYEEVQVLKGPSGLMFGRGTTGGAINTITKTPFLEDRILGHAEAGNGDHYRATADINHVLSDTAALRLNLMVTDTGVVDRDITHSTRFGIAPSLALGLGTDTQVTLSYLHQQTAAHQDYGMVAVQPPGSIYSEPATEFGVPRANYIGLKTDVDKNTADLITARINHSAGWLSLENAARVAVYSRYFQYTSVDSCDATCTATLFDPDPNVRRTTLAAAGGGGPYQQNSWGLQDVGTARADFHVGGLRNTLVAGFDVSYQRADRTIFAYNLPASPPYFYALGNHTPNRRNIGFSLYNPGHVVAPDYTVVRPTPANVVGTSASPTTTAFSTGDATDLALFATDRLWLNDAWSVIAGVRVDRYDAHYSATTVAGDYSTLKAPSTLVNPRASLVYEPDQRTTFYFSWGKSATPPGTSVAGSPSPLRPGQEGLDPEKSETLEVGTKLSLLNGALGVTGSLFKVVKNNATVTDPLTGNIDLQSGQKQRAQGVELSATGTILPGWSLTGAYTYLDAVVTGDLSCGGTPVVCLPNPYTIGRQVEYVPKNALSLWSDWQADWLTPGLSLGGGVIYQSRLYDRLRTTGSAPHPTGIAFITRFPETVELDAVVAYDFAPYRVQLNVNNLTDRLNYSQTYGNRGTPAPGRTFIVSLEAAL